MARIRIEQLETPAEFELGASQAGKVVGAGPVIVGPYGYYGGWYGGVTPVSYWGYGGPVVNVTPNWGTVLGPGGYQILPSPIVLGPGMVAGWGMPRYGGYVGW
jgi:hypothetical protein